MEQSDDLKQGRKHEVGNQNPHRGQTSFLQDLTILIVGYAHSILGPERCIKITFGPNGTKEHRLKRNLRQHILQDPPTALIRCMIEESSWNWHPPHTIRPNLFLPRNCHCSKDSAGTGPIGLVGHYFWGTYGHQFPAMNQAELISDAPDIMEHMMKNKAPHPADIRQEYRPHPCDQPDRGLKAGSSRIRAAV